MKCIARGAELCWGGLMLCFSALIFIATTVLMRTEILMSSTPELWGWVIGICIFVAMAVIELIKGGF